MASACISTRVCCDGGSETLTQILAINVDTRLVELLHPTHWVDAMIWVLCIIIDLVVVVQYTQLTGWSRIFLVSVTLRCRGKLNKKTPEIVA